MKSALLAFRMPADKIEERMRQLLAFLHKDLARFPQFEIYAAYRFFLLNSQETFFKGVQQNAARLVRTLRSMAWDLTHWHSMFDLAMMHSGAVENTPFPVPHFLSFDRPFIQLIEKFRLDGVIYAGNRKRCEQIYSESILLEVSQLLRGPLSEFYTDTAINDRKQRIAASSISFDERLVTLNSELSEELSQI